MRSRLILISGMCLGVALSPVFASARAPMRSAFVAGGCGGTELNRGALPAWTAPAMADSTRTSDWPFALSRRRNVAAIIFGYPLRAGTPAGRLFTSASSDWSTSRTVWPLSRIVIRVPAHATSIVFHAGAGRAGLTVGPLYR